MSPHQSPQVKPRSVAALAERWSVSPRTVQAWKSKGVPVDDDAGMVAYYSSLTAKQQQGTTHRFRAALDRARKGATPSAPDADFASFEASYRPELADANTLATLKTSLAWFLTQHRAAAAAGDTPGADAAVRQIRELSSVIHDFEIRQQRLGRDLGDLVKRSELEHVAKFMSYHLLRCCDAALGKLAKAICERDPQLPPITVQEIRAMGESPFLTAMVWEPIEQAAKGTNSAAPPAWLVAALKEGRAEVLEE